MLRRTAPLLRLAQNTQIRFADLAVIASMLRWKVNRFYSHSIARSGSGRTRD
jgi:hypothetical protein